MKVVINTSPLISLSILEKLQFYLESVLSVFTERGLYTPYQ